MNGKGLGVVGLGRIGMAVAKIAVAFSCRISYFARLEKTGVPYKFYDTILELANNSDMFVLACALRLWYTQHLQLIPWGRRRWKHVSPSLHKPSSPQWRTDS